MSNTQKIVCMVYTGYTFCGLSVLWMILEKILYGAVQHRIVDDIISIPILAVIYFMWLFKMERDNLRKGLK